MDRDVQEVDTGAAGGVEAVGSEEPQATAAIEPETPLMLTDAMCGLACQVKRETRPV